VSKHVREVCARFGIPDPALLGLEPMESQGTVFVGTREVMEFAAVRPMRRGLRLARIYPRSLKPTGFGLQALGQSATRNLIDLDDLQVRLVSNGKSIKVEAPVEDGFTLLRWQGFIVGVGLYKRPMLKSQVPRYRPVD